MRLTKISTLFLALLAFANSSCSASHPTKKTAKTMQEVKQSQPVSQSASHTNNHTSSMKKMYGVNGAMFKYRPISNKQHSYTVKGFSFRTLGKEGSRQYTGEGVASYYGGFLHGHKTSSGEVFNTYAYTAAHPTLALGSYALVQNIKNGRYVIVRINDRGPFRKTRVIDLSEASAKELGMIGLGLARVKIQGLQVDKDGYVSGKGVETLIQIAKKKQIPLKIKGSNQNLAIKSGI
ncbi:hypothetical protein A4G19_04865 [Pasteurellaceae bacterium Macca]|nr:hypothetical protein [Pasteurellaceae bacterium Macca]